MELLKEYNSPAKAAAEVAVRFGVSRSQAHRYVRKAGAMTEKMVVPGHKIPFTIKLSQDLRELALTELPLMSKRHPAAWDRVAL